MFLLALIGYHSLPHEYSRGVDLGQLIGGGKRIVDAFADGVAKDDEGIAEQVGQTAQGATEIIQAFLNDGFENTEDFEANSLLLVPILRAQRGLNDVSAILANLKGLSNEVARVHLKQAATILKSVEMSLKALPVTILAGSYFGGLKQRFHQLSAQVNAHLVALSFERNESRSWASFCKGFLKVWDGIVKVVDAIFRGNDFDENVLLDAVEQKLGRSFQTRQITRTRVDGGVWVRGTADNIALSAYYHDSKAHSVAIKTGLSAKILPEKQQIAQPGEWAIAIGPVESADGNQALYKLE